LSVPSQNTQAIANSGKRNQINASVNAYNGTFEKTPEIRHTAQKTKEAFTQNTRRNLPSFNLSERPIKPKQIIEIQASAGLLSISKIKGPNSQKMRQNLSDKGNSDNASAVFRKIFCEAFHAKNDSPKIEKWLDKMECSEGNIFKK
tara:strand:+ start:21 stop:458 length:438 start_codon:yes stop_codon:yes gene_type:complete